MKNKILVREQQQFNKLKKSISPNGRLMSAGTLLQRAAHLFGTRTALIYKEDKISYNQLYARACALSEILKQKGVKPHDRVLLCFENSPAFYIAYFAIWQCGAVVAPLNTFLRQYELAHIVNDAKPVLIITSTDHVQLFKEAELTDLPPIITEKDFDFDKPESAPSKDFIIPYLEPDDMTALLYTSGTTGLPKGVMLSSRNIMTAVLQSVVRIELDKHERVFGVLPLFHVFAQVACIWGAFFVGATVIVVPRIDRRYILEGLKHKPTIFLGVPALYGLLCLMKNAPLSSVRYFVSGGDALPDKIRSYFALLYRRRLCGGYGLTETSPIIAADFDDEAGPTNRVGYPVVGVQCSIRDEQGNQVTYGSIGELWVKGDNVMLGYYNAPKATQKVLKDGWLNTGDLAYFDAKGKLIIAGRTKDLIISKGFNIYPQEIENVILSYPNALQVGVIGRKDNDVGEIVIAFVQLRTQEADAEKKIRKLCREHLASYKIPRDFICTTESLPITATGKVDKKVLRKQLVENE